QVESVPTGQTPRESDFPKPLDPVDDLPPATVITHWRRAEGGNLVVRGTTSDNGTVKTVLVNGKEARAVAPNFAEWEATLPEPAEGPGELRARAEDAAGNVEPQPHVVRLTAASPGATGLTGLEGTWTGDSLCQVPGSPGRDEKAVYRISRP